jgi:hypothetical protein
LPRQGRSHWIRRNEVLRHIDSQEMVTWLANAPRVRQR